MARLKNLMNWFLEGKWLYIFVILVILIFHLDQMHIGLECVENIRIYGLFLEIVGTLTIVYSLKEKLFLFKGYGFRSFFANYFGRFPLIKIKKTQMINVDTGHLTLTSSEPRVKTLPKEDHKDIIRYFNEEIKYIHRIMLKEKNDFSLELNKIKTDFHSSETANKDELRKTKQLISDSSLSNIWMDAFGILAILLGLILGTVPKIVERLIF